MLDQNTDRMWYVIGAVLIGAAIIFGMNTMFPNALASVGDSFTSVIDTTAESIGMIGSFDGNYLQGVNGAPGSIDWGGDGSRIYTVDDFNYRDDRTTRYATDAVRIPKGDYIYTVDLGEGIPSNYSVELWVYGLTRQSDGTYLRTIRIPWVETDSIEFNIGESNTYIRTIVRISDESGVLVELEDHPEYIEYIHQSIVVVGDGD